MWKDRTVFPIFGNFVTLCLDFELSTNDIKTSTEAWRLQYVFLRQRGFVYVKKLVEC